MLTILEFSAGALLYAALGAAYWLVSPGNITFFEKLCRNRIIGLIGALPAAFICVRLAQPVTPGILLPLLLPAAVIIPVVSTFYIDFYASRTIAFWMILLAYDVVNVSFIHHVPGAPVCALLSWLLGVAGIWISAKPCTLRDTLRCAANKKSCRWIFLAAAALGAVMMAGVTVAVSGELL